MQHPLPSQLPSTLGSSAPSCNAAAWESPVLRPPPRLAPPLPAPAHRCPAGNRQPLPTLPRDSRFTHPEEDVTLQGRGHGRITPCLISDTLHPHGPTRDTLKVRSLGRTRTESPQLDGAISAAPSEQMQSCSFTAGLQPQLPPVPETLHMHTAPGHCCHRTRRATRWPKGCSGPNK